MRLGVITQSNNPIQGNRNHTGLGLKHSDSTVANKYVSLFIIVDVLPSAAIAMPIPSWQCSLRDQHYTTHCLSFSFVFALMLSSHLLSVLLHVTSLSTHSDEPSSFLSKLTFEHDTMPTSSDLQDSHHPFSFLPTPSLPPTSRAWKDIPPDRRLSPGYNSIQESHDIKSSMV